MLALAAMLLASVSKLPSSASLSSGEDICVLPLYEWLLSNIDAMDSTGSLEMSALRISQMVNSHRKDGHHPSDLSGPHFDQPDQAFGHKRIETSAAAATIIRKQRKK